MTKYSIKLFDSYKVVGFEKSDSNKYSDLLKYNVHQSSIGLLNSTECHKILKDFLMSVDDPTDTKLVEWKTFMKSDKSNCEHVYQDQFSQQAYTNSGLIVKVSGWVCYDCGKEYVEMG